MVRDTCAHRNPSYVDISAELAGVFRERDVLVEQDQRRSVEPSFISAVHECNFAAETVCVQGSRSHRRSSKVSLTSHCRSKRTNLLEHGSCHWWLCVSRLSATTLLPFSLQVQIILYLNVCEPNATWRCVRTPKMRSRAIASSSSGVSVIPASCVRCANETRVL